MGEQGESEAELVAIKGSCWLPDYDRAKATLRLPQAVQQPCRPGASRGASGTRRHRRTAQLSRRRAARLAAVSGRAAIPRTRPGPAGPQSRPGGRRRSVLRLVEAHRGFQPQRGPTSCPPRRGPPTAVPREAHLCSRTGGRSGRRNRPGARVPGRWRGSGRTLRGVRRGAGEPSWLGRGIAVVGLVPPGPGARADVAVYRGPVRAVRSERAQQHRAAPGAPPS
jgi:hypothetical protein